MIQARYPLSKVRVGFFELVEKFARFEKSSAYQHLQLEIHDSKEHLYFKFSWSVARCRLSVIFILKLTSRTQVFYVGDWRTSYLGSSAKLILQEVEVTVQFHFLRRILEDPWCNCARSATSDLQRDSSLPKTWIILSLRTVGICFYYLFN